MYQYENIIQDLEQHLNIQHFLKELHFGGRMTRANEVKSPQDLKPNNRSTMVSTNVLNYKYECSSAQKKLAFPLH